MTDHTHHATSETKKAKKDEDDEPLTRESVQRMIDASLIRHDLTHGHLGADEAAAKLKTLDQD